VLTYLFKNFECAVNDFSDDPPPSVGFDSLRNLGHRLDALEKGYAIAVRPTVLLLRPDSSEIERIAYPNLLTADQFIKRVQEYMAGINTVESLRRHFWQDSSNFGARRAYLDRLSARSEYDSVIYQLGVIAQMRDHLAEARDAARQYAYLRLNVEGQTQYLRTWIASLRREGQDSLDALQGLRDLLEFYQARKKVDSVAAAYDRIFAFTGVRDPETLNNYAWDLASHSKQWEKALTLINEAIAGRPDIADFYDTRALTHWSLKQYDSAVQDAEQALSHATGSDDRSYFKERLEFYRAELKRSKEPKPSVKESGNEDTK
jgi:tetratricopeptide (TPR) repeat protein